ncbi:MAG: DUF1553 domain-containing protein [Bacteroidota bacterium]
MFIHHFSRLLFLLAVGCLLSACGAELPEEVELELAGLPTQVDFNQHIRPILSDRCWSCHGPDAGSRQVGLRLDTEDGAFALLASGKKAIVPNQPFASEALVRILSDDPERVMPVPGSNITLTPREIALLYRWIEQGAAWKEHWAFLPILAPASVPNNPAAYPAENEIDHFLNARLQEEGLSANERADPERLLRRLYLDLTGLPPSPEQMDAWLEQPNAENYALIVDELLESDAHAERLATEWLDLARYADSHGMHTDGYRLSYPYRDWVLQALRDNQPFDQFVREQLAGDLLPDPSQNQLVATAFNRMHPMTAEGGVIDEEMRLSYVFDRVNTVATGLLGLTMDCSRCHDHKFDPIDQAEYYSFSAFFNNFRELGMTPNDGNVGPTIFLTDSLTRQRLKSLRSELKEITPDRTIPTIDSLSLATFLEQEKVQPPAPDGHYPFDAIVDKDGLKVDGRAPATASVTITKDELRGQVLCVDHPYDDIWLEQGVGQYRTVDPFTISIHAKTTKLDASLTQTLVGTAGYKADLYQGVDVYLDGESHLNFRLIKALADDFLHVRSQAPLDTGRWYHVTVTYDGTGQAAGMQLYCEGQAIPQTIEMDDLNGEIYPTEHVRWIKKGTPRVQRVAQAYRGQSGENGIFQGWLDDLRFYDRELTALEIARLHNPEAPITHALAIAHLGRLDTARQRAFASFRARKAEQISLQDTLTRFMASAEMETPRATFRLDRGSYEAPQEQVFPATPARVLPFPADVAPNRLGLTEWLFHPDHPLTARVAVNRYWQLIFGRGIVSTPHDFGAQGALPSHPRLLDFLATQFRDSGWDIRALLRMMVLSDAYQRSSSASREQREQDPENQLLARGASVRMPAEMIRDNALAASGLLVRKTGGPSVRPYQPAGLWLQSSNFTEILRSYQQDHGEDLYRRSLYTFLKRTSPPPFLTNFDGASRQICEVKRSVTNTPLQALNLLNAPEFVEAARVLAQRVQAEKEETDEQLARAFRLVNGRRAKPAELDLSRQLYTSELERFTANPAVADSLLAVGEYPLVIEFSRPKTAALTSVGNVLFNFDEAYVKR